MNTLIVQAQDWKEELGQAGKNFLDVYNDGIQFEYYKKLGFDTMQPCLQAISIEYGWSKSVAAALAVEHLPALEAEAKERQRGGQGGILLVPKVEQAKSIETAGQLFNVGKSYVNDAKNLKQQNPELFEQVKNGQVSLSQAKIEQETITLKKSHIVQNYYTLESWERLDKDFKSMLLSKDSDKTFNQTNDNIEWARYSWNPITGCLHNCTYCYARDIANRFYPQGFIPTLHPERLTAPKNTKQKDLSRFNNPVDKIGYQNVFVCSMSDLFGKWTPTEWIEAVLTQIRNNPQWTFLLLTKFPIRMAEFDYPKNTWLGTTVDYQYAVSRAEKAFIKIKDSGYQGICWLSCEPMMEQLTFNSLDIFDWIAIGGSSKSSQTEEYKPPFDDINHLYNQAKLSNTKIYFKTNLLGNRIREYPTL